MVNTDLYQTTDIRLATVLSMKYPIIDLINNNGRGTFIFENSEDLQEYIKDFWNRRLTCEINSLFDAQEIIKSRINSEIRRINK